MHLTAFPLAALFAIALAQNEQNENPFKVPPGFALTAGKPTTLNWTPTTSGTVTLRLREGVSNDLDTVETIQASIPNSGSYTYTPPADLTRNSDYVIEIVSDEDPSATNYTPFFVLESTNTVPKQNSESASSSGASTASASSAAASSAAETSAAASSSSESAAAASSSASSAASSSDAASSSSSSRASRTAASKTSAASESAAPTATSTGAGSEAGSDPGPSAVPSNGAVSGLRVQGGLIAILLGAFVAF